MKWLKFILCVLPLVVCAGEEDNLLRDSSAGLRGLKALKLIGDGPAEKALRVELTKAGVPLSEDATTLVEILVDGAKMDVVQRAGESTVWTAQVLVISAVSVLETAQPCVGVIWRGRSVLGYFGSAIKQTPAEQVVGFIKKSMADELASDWIKAQSNYKNAQGKKRETAVSVKQWCEEHRAGGSITLSDGRVVEISAEETFAKWKAACEVLGIAVPANRSFTTIHE